MSDVLAGFLEGILGSDQMTLLQHLGVFGSHLALAAVIALVTLFVATRARGGIERLFDYRKGDRGLAILLGRIVFFLVLFFGVLLILPIFGLNATALFAALGVLGLAVSLALQDVLKNVVAGIYLLIERPFRPGEIVKVRDFVGTVETVELRTTTLRSDGELVYVPNAILFAEVLINRGPARVPTDESK
jgi:small-conductance mechanosensitive channel